MTAFQLAVLAQAPCSSTMAGLGPLAGTARAVVWAEAIWLRGMIRAAMATARAGMMRRGLAWRAARAMFTVSSLSGDAERAFGRMRGVNRQVPDSTVPQETIVGYPQRHCSSVNSTRPSMRKTVSTILPVVRPTSSTSGPPKARWTTARMRSGIRTPWLRTPGRGYGRRAGPVTGGGSCWHHPAPHGWAEVSAALLQMPGRSPLGLACGAGPCDHVAQLVAAGDPELGERPVQVRDDRARGQEEPVADLAVGQAVAGQPDDLALLRGQLPQGIGRAGCAGDNHPGRSQLGLRPLRPGPGPEPPEGPQGLGQDGLSVVDPPAPPQPRSEE